MLKAVVGIDVGKKGGICKLNLAGDVIDLLPMKELNDLHAFLTQEGQSYMIHHVFVEKAQAMPKNGSVGMFNYGDGFGQIKGLLTGLKIPFTLVPPQTWSKVIHQGCGKGTAKEKTMRAVKRLFPKVDLIPPRGRVPHEGMMDALAIGEYGRRLFYCGNILD